MITSDVRLRFLHREFVTAKRIFAGIAAQLKMTSLQLNSDQTFIQDCHESQEVIHHDEDQCRER
jgi:hypothetical protein